MATRHYAGLAICLVVFALLLAACGDRAAQEPTPVPPTATATPVPPTPTPTPIPLSTWVEQGYAALYRSDYAGAVELFQQAADADPSYVEAIIGLAKTTYWQAGHESRALELAQQAVELGPENAAAHAVLADAQRSMFANAAAMETAEKAADLAPDDALVQATLARTYLRDRQYDAALAAARRAIELDADLPEAYWALEGYYWIAGEAGRVQSAIKRGLELQPDFAPWHIALGDLWTALGRHELAQAAYEHAAALAPDEASALLNLAYLAMNQGDYATAEEHLEQATGLIPDAPQIFLAKGRLLRAQRENDDARAQYRKALNQRADYPAALEAMGWTYIADGETDLAVRQFQTLMAAHPRSPDGLVGMGFARLQDGDASKALEYLRKAIKLDPFDEWAHEGLADAYAVQERWDEANLAYAQALAVGLSDGQSHRDIATDLLNQDDAEGARGEFELALRLDPAGVDNSQAHSNLALLAMLDGDLDAAESHARAALQLDPDDTVAQKLLGTILLRQGEYEEVIATLEAVVEEEPDDGYAHYILGLAYKGEERFPEAKKALETYVALAPYGVDSRTRELVDALDQGYYLTEAKALSDLLEEMEEEMGREATAAVIEDGPLGRTLAITLTADAEQEEPRQVYVGMATAAAYGSGCLARIEPAVTGGVVVRLTEDGQTLLTMVADHATAVEFSDGILDATQFVRGLEFQRTAPGEAQATVEEIKLDVSSTRALSATADVPYQVMSEEELRARYESRLDDQDHNGMDDSQAMLALLGVIPAGTDLESLLLDLNSEQVNGFYNFEEKVFYLVDRGESTTDDQMTMAHEYVHALQDQHHDLAALSELGANSDEQAAIRALIEGDATLAMLLYADEHIVLYDMMESMSEAGGMESDTLEASPLFIREHEIFPYQGGLEFVSALHARGDWEAVDAAYDALPRSTEQILHPERYRSHDDPIEVTLPDLAGALGGDWQEVEREVMGELALRLYLQEHAGPVMAGLAAEGWGGDAYSLLRNGDQGPYLLVMETVWDDQKEADQFVALYRVAMSHRAGFEEVIASLTEDPVSFWWRGGDTVTAIHQDGETVSIVIGPDTSSIETVLSVLQE